MGRGALLLDEHALMTKTVIEALKLGVLLVKATIQRRPGANLDGAKLDEGYHIPFLMAVAVVHLVLRSNFAERSHLDERKTPTPCWISKA